jgi:gas vesicle protein
MSDNSSSSGFAFLAGVVIGAAVGAVAGLLFAPATGEETRSRLADKSKDIAEEHQEKFEDLRETVTDVIEDVKDAAQTKLEEVKETAQAKIEEVKGAKAES